MANPQLQDGHIRIANEIWEALCRMRIPPNGRQVLDVILRKTYGFNKKADAISYSQFRKHTGIRHDRQISRAIAWLEKRQIVSTDSGVRGQTAKYKFNKDYDRWKTTDSPVLRTEMSSDNTGHKVRTKVSDTKDTITKDNNIAGRPASGLVICHGPKSEVSIWQEKVGRIIEYLTERFGELPEGKSYGGIAGKIMKQFQDYRSSGEEVVWILENCADKPQSPGKLLAYLNSFDFDRRLEVASDARRNCPERE